jgi:hypothetical protein
MPKSSRSRSRKYSRRPQSRSRKYSRRPQSRSRKYSRRPQSRSRKYSRRPRKYSRRPRSRSGKYSRRRSRLKAFEYYTPIDRVLNELKLDEQNDNQLIWVNPTMSKYGPIPLSYTFYIYKHNKNNKVETFSSQSLSVNKNYKIHPIVEKRVKQLSSYSKEERIDYYINWNT